MTNIFSKLNYTKKKEIYFERDMSPDKSKKLKKSIKENINGVHDYLYDCDDIITRDFYMGQTPKHQMSLMFIDGMVDKDTLQNDILKPLMLFTRQFPLEYSVGENFFNMVKEGLLTAGDLKESDNFGEVILGILSGDTVLFLDKVEKALVISTRGWEKRGVEEPSTEAVIRGPRDGFTETYRTNVALIRRRLRDPNLKVKTIKLGRHTRTDVGIMFIQGVGFKRSFMLGNFIVFVIYFNFTWINFSIYKFTNKVVRH